MSTQDNEPKNDANEVHAGFIWSQRARIIVAFILALALAAARFGPVLAAPIEWQR